MFRCDYQSQPPEPNRAAGDGRLTVPVNENVVTLPGATWDRNDRKRRPRLAQKQCVASESQVMAVEPSAKPNTKFVQWPKLMFDTPPSPVGFNSVFLDGKVKI